jgi:hypothetical protein
VKPEIKKVVLNYTDWKGETRIYIVTPVVFFWGSTNYYPELQWLMTASLHEQEVHETFAMSGINSWRAYDLQN